MGRQSHCLEKGVKKGPWTVEEDQKLTAYIQKHGHGSWRTLPEKAGLQRCGKSCRLRWINYLRPDIKRGNFSLQEEQTIIQLHALLGNRWSAIAAHLSKRTDNEIKNFWNTHLKKRLMKMGIDPMTHKPRRHAPEGGGCDTNKNAANLSHMAQWESARLEAEARLVRESKQTPSQTQPNPLPAWSAVRPAASSPAPPKCLDVLKAWQGVVAGMFSLGSQDLESPTSTFNNPLETAKAPAAGFDEPRTGIVGAREGPDNQGRMHEFLDGIGNNYADVAWFEESTFAAGEANDAVLMEGLSDKLDGDAELMMTMNCATDAEKSSGICGGIMGEIRDNSYFAWDF